MLAVAGLTFAYTSCTDYSKDIDENKNQIDAVSSELATAKQQIESMKTDISNLQTAKTEAEKAIAALQTSLKDLQTKHDADVKALRAEYAAADEAVKADIQKKIDALQKAHETEVSEIKTTIENLQKSVTDLEKKVGSIEETIKTLATKQELSDAKTWAQVTFVTKDTMKVVNATLGALQARLEAAEKKAAALEEKHTSDVKDLTDKIAAAKKAADDAKAHSVEVLGKVEALKTGLGVYADSGVLAAKIEALTAKDTELADSLSKKLNIRDFGAEFDKAIEKALKADGKVGKEIADQIKTAKDALEAQIKDLKTYVNTKFDYLYSVAKQLKSLVFVPDLYVDGIEATEYTYADYVAQVASLVNSKVKEGVYIDYGFEYGDGTQDNKVKAQVLNKKWQYSNEIDKKKNIVHTYVNPASVVTYKMNPSTADVTAETPLTFISDDKEFVNVNTTKASVKNPKNVRFVSAENGELKVDFTAVGEAANRKGEEGYVSIFALQATVKNGEGQDTTVTSDFARLLTNSLTFQALAFTKADYTSTLDCGPQDHIYPTLKEAIENAPSVKVKYDETLDLQTVVTNHFTSRKYKTHADYAQVYPNNDYGVTYSFEGVDYKIGTNATSETQHVWLNGDVFTPCGVTTEYGTRDENAIGAAAFTSVGRRPIVRVEMKIGNKVVLAGFIKFEIVKQSDYKVADPFEWPYRFFCGGFTNKTSWSQMENNVIRLSGLTKEEFCQMYAIEPELDDNGNVATDSEKHVIAVQYIKGADGKFHALPYDVKSGNTTVTYKKYGTVCEVKDAVPGTTTDILEWTIGLADLSEIYRAKDHKTTIYVRYTLNGKPATTEYDGIFVPLTAVVDKPVSSVSKKLSNYWFNNGASAKINVAVPHATTITDPTKPWETDINQVWEKNVPQFNFGAPYTQAKGGQVYSYKYYFAPEQPSYSINGLTYQFIVANQFIVDAFIGQQPTVASKKLITKNADVKTYEYNYAADVNRGIYANTVLSCKVFKGNKPQYTFIVATIDPATNKVTYDDNKDAKFLLNYFASVPSQYTEAKLYANIGVTAYCSEHVAMPLEGAINPYHFLRPVNAVAATDKFFVDGADQHKDESNINVFDVFSFNDWRGEAFFKPAVGETPADYSNLWYFKYYNVSAIEVDLKNVTTSLDGGTLGTTLLTAKTKDINLEYWSGDKVTPEFKSTVADQKALPIVLNTPANPTEWAKDAELKYEYLVKKFGYIHYHNNGTPIETPFTLRVPVKFTYTWGTINSSVDILVKNL